MENTQPTKTENEFGSREAISGDSIKSEPVAEPQKNVSTTSSSTTTAATPKGSRKIWTSAELAELRLRAGLVAGALADFQAAGGIVVTKNVDADGVSSVKIYLVADGVNLVAKKTPDGTDLVAEPSNLAAEASGRE
jgi:hypothetical protein